MATLPVLLLTITLGTESGLSLECYSCNVSKYAGCIQTENCTVAQKYCMARTVTTTRGFVIEQGCVDVCPIAVTSWPALYTYICCQENKCNSVASTRRSIPLLTIVMVINTLAIMEL